MEHSINVEFKAVQADSRAGAKADSDVNAHTSQAFATQSAQELTPQALAAKKAVEQVAARINALSSANKGGRKVRDIINDINAKYKETAIKQDEEGKEGNPGFAYEIEIDYPQKARWRVINKKSLYLLSVLPHHCKGVFLPMTLFPHKSKPVGRITQIIEVSGAAITTRGTYFPPGKQPGPTERKLYLFIEGDSEMVIDIAKNEVKRILRRRQWRKWNKMRELAVAVQLAAILLYKSKCSENKFTLTHVIGNEKKQIS